MNVFIDIETIPSSVTDEEMIKQEIGEGIKPPATIKKQETIDAWMNGEGKYAGAKDAAIDTEFRKRSFSGAQGQICSMAWAIGDDEIVSCHDEDGVSERSMLQYFFDSVLFASEKSNPYFIGHNVSNFDMRFIYHRAVVNNIRPSFPIKWNGRHNSDFYCTMQGWGGYKDMISMDNLAKALGIKGKGDMNGSMVWDEWRAGNIDKVVEYNKDDVKIVREVFNRLTFGGDI